MKKYLAYGSNMNLEQMAVRCPGAKPLGTAVLHDYKLVFRGSRGGAVATVEPHKGGNVPILLWTLPKADEAALDHYEGWPYLYRKETLKVELDGKQTKAMAYIMNDGRQLGTPSRYYYGVIADGYRSAGLNVNDLNTAVWQSANESAANE